MRPSQVKSIDEMVQNDFSFHVPENQFNMFGEMDFAKK